MGPATTHSLQHQSSGSVGSTERSDSTHSVELSHHPGFNFGMPSSIEADVRRNSLKEEESGNGSATDFGGYFNGHMDQRKMSSSSDRGPNGANHFGGDHEVRHSTRR